MFFFCCFFYLIWKNRHGIGKKAAIFDWEWALEKGRKCPATNGLNMIEMMFSLPFTCWQLLLSADNLCKQFGPRSVWIQTI